MASQNNLEELRQKLLELLSRLGKIEEKPKIGIDLSKLPILFQLIEHLIRILDQLKRNEQLFLYIVKRENEVTFLESHEKLNVNNLDKANKLFTISCNTEKFSLKINKERYSSIFIISSTGIKEFEPTFFIEKLD